MITKYRMVYPVCVLAVIYVFITTVNKFYVIFMDFVIVYKMYILS